MGIERWLWSSVKSTCCSCIEPKISSQHPWKMAPNNLYNSSSRRYNILSWLCWALAFVGTNSHKIRSKLKKEAPAPPKLEMKAKVFQVKKLVQKATHKCIERILLRSGGPQYNGFGSSPNSWNNMPKKQGLPTMPSSSFPWTLDWL